MASKSLFLIAGLLSLVCMWATPSSHAYSADVETLSLKGYSPDTIDLAMHARSQTELRGIPAPKRTTAQMFLYNLIHNDPTGSLDQPGFSVIRRD
jgi:hypothetical protein